MRFGISLISWMLPKILRMRREVLDRPSVVAGASIALVAMVFPALLSAGLRRRPGDARPGRAMMWGAWSRASFPMRGARALVRALSREGREKPRAHESVRRSRLCVDR